MNIRMIRRAQLFIIVESKLDLVRIGVRSYQNEQNYLFKIDIIPREAKPLSESVWLFYYEKGIYRLLDSWVSFGAGSLHPVFSCKIIYIFSASRYIYNYL